MFASDASVVCEYFEETSASETTVGSLGFATRIVGVTVEGNWRCAACTALSTLAMFSVSVDCNENCALIETCPLWIVVSM